MLEAQNIPEVAGCLVFLQSSFWQADCEKVGSRTGVGTIPQVKQKKRGRGDLRI